MSQPIDHHTYAPYLRGCHGSFIIVTSKASVSNQPHIPHRLIQVQIQYSNFPLATPHPPAASTILPSSSQTTQLSVSARSYAFQSRQLAQAAVPSLQGIRTRLGTLNIPQTLRKREVMVFINSDSVYLGDPGDLVFAAHVFEGVAFQEEGGGEQGAGDFRSSMLWQSGTGS